MILRIENICQSFGKIPVLQDLSLSAQSGQCVGLLGENGSGKSTLFGVLTGLHRGKGTFWCDDIDLMRDHTTRRKRVGFVPQSPPFLSELTALDNLRLWYSSAALKQSLENGALAMLGVEEFLHSRVSRLSGGMQKRLAIGCAVAGDPDILLLDEPTAALDLVCKEHIYRYLRAFCENGGVVLMATHDVRELQQCDTVYVLRDGRLTPFEGERTPERLVGCLRCE